MLNNTIAHKKLSGACENRLFVKLKLEKNSLISGVLKIIEIQLFTILSIKFYTIFSIYLVS